MPKLAPLAVLLCLASGCTYPAGPGSTNLTDGSYKGRPALQAAAPQICPDTHYGYFEIADRDLHFAYLPGIVFDAAVNPDGSLHDTRGPAVLDGKVGDDHLTLSVTTPDCHTDYNMRFVWNHS